MWEDYYKNVVGVVHCSCRSARRFVWFVWGSSLLVGSYTNRLVPTLRGLFIFQKFLLNRASPLQFSYSADQLDGSSKSRFVQHLRSESETEGYLKWLEDKSCSDWAVERRRGLGGKLGRANAYLISQPSSSLIFTSSRLSAPRRFTSTLSSLRVLLLTTTRTGMPNKSASANLAPALRSSLSS